ncbi:ferritin-like domain-containing protein [Stieleria sp. JC731]|uniref:YciE/YciF ferroxidase family protein n=1 Tax=Pirellulaceae TaxID=2691357 RepID=UPI001E2FEFE3|nr:ferritin-like domain-containing protein [Stieleria sp. JC731]MCC9599432.1 ferritin-like domain-containing protein [Stieleria sp. JC731]
MKLDSLYKLFVHELKDLYSAETQLLDALPKMQEAASNDELKAAFENHLQETKTHVSRLENIFTDLEFEPGGHKCAAMEGLIKECESILKSDIEPSVLDAALIAAAQRVEHYEMAGYGTARTFAEKLGHQNAADILQETLNEEGHANQTLSRLAERKINFLAMGMVS